MDIYNYQQQTKTKRNSMSAYVPVHRRNEEDDKRNSMNNNKYRSSNQDLQVESSISTGSTKRSSFMGYRRPPSQQNNRQSRNSFIGDDDVDYVS
jgi:hypothetical protein